MLSNNFVGGLHKTYQWGILAMFGKRDEFMKECCSVVDILNRLSGWWFQTFFIFHNIWDNPFHWLIFFKMVKTTNQFGIDDFEISCGYSNYETCQSPKKIDRWTCKEGFFMCPWGQEGFDMWSVSMVPMCKSPTKPWSKMATENTPFYSSHMLHVWNMYQHLP